MKRNLNKLMKLSQLIRAELSSSRQHFTATQEAHSSVSQKYTEASPRRLDKVVEQRILQKNKSSLTP